MTDQADTPEPVVGFDLNAELARINDDLKSLNAVTAAMRGDTDHAALIADLEGLIPEADRAALPTDGSHFDQIFARVTAAIKAAKKPAVPVTDTTRPPTTPPAPDLSGLPAHARMARGYGNA